MQSQVTVAYMNNLKQAISLQASARLLAEWNHNRFAGPPTVVNTGFANTDTDEFPLDSIVAPNRPNKQGILKARATERDGKSWPLPTVEGYVQSAYDDSVVAAGKRSYTVSKDSKYKYWSSPTSSSATLTGGIYPLTSGSLEVTYTKAVWMNKVVASFEAGVVKPKNITVYYKTTSNGAWTQWTGTFQADANGVLTLYRQTNGTMSATQTLTAPLKVFGIKMAVAGTDRGDTHLNVIELSARLQLDLSDFIMDYGVESSMSDTSFVAPLGTCTSNTGKISFDNTDGRFDNDRPFLRTGPENILFGLIDKNIRFQMDLGLMVNGSYEYTRQFTMWSDEWDSQNESKAGVSIRDSSKFLQEVKPNATLYQSITTSGAVWRICDSVGFNDYVIDAAALNDNHVMNFFWTDPEKTAWEHMEEISVATQTAVYFDEYDVLRVMPRSAAYDISKPVSWTFDGAAVGSTAVAQGRPVSDNNKVADIVSLDQTYDFEANTVNVKYTPTAVSKMNGTIPVMEEVWSPEGDSNVVLRASRLIQSMTDTAGALRITPTEAALWPYSGTVQIEGEFIKYEAKGYTYRNASAVWVSTSIKSIEDKKKLDDLNPFLAYANYFNGYLYCPNGRKQWNSAARAHNVDIDGWNSNKYRATNGPVRVWNGGIVHNKTNGTYQMVTNKTFINNSWYVSTRGLAGETPPIYYGTRIRFPTSGYGFGAAGIATNVGTNDSGYFAEILRTAVIDAKSRATISNELVFYRRDANGVVTRIGPNGGKGLPVEIIAGKWYDLDMRIVVEGGVQQVYIMINGATKMNFPIPANLALSLGGRYGMFTRGWTSAEFEYYYSSTTAVNDSFDEAGWFDQISGGYQSGQATRDWIYNTGSPLSIRTKRFSPLASGRSNGLFFDEFGPVVHEVREYEVKFDKKPVIHSNLYFTNTTQAICPEYSSNPFGAKFVLANTTRRNAVVNGEDTLTFGAENPVQQKMLIYGRVVEREEEETVTVSSPAAVNMRGTVEVDIGSAWIQSKTAAEKIGEWITSHWGGGTDEVSVETIGNPVLQIGDVVSIAYPNKSMTHLTHKYFVVGISHQFGGSMTTTFTLRRLKL